VSGDQEGLVKIWNCRKQLIREIKFVEPVNSVAFLNPQADIIVGHSGNLSRLDAKDYMEKRMYEQMKLAAELYKKGKENKSSSQTEEQYQ